MHRVNLVLLFLLLLTFSACQHDEPSLTTGSPTPFQTSRDNTTPTPGSPTPSQTPLDNFALTPGVSIPFQTLIGRPDPKWTSFTNTNTATDLVLDDDGHLWATTTGGVVRWDISTKTYHVFGNEHGLPEFPTNVVLAEDGTLWFGAPRTGLYHYDGQVWMIYAPDLDLIGHPVTNITIAPDGNVWGVLYNVGLFRFDGDTWTSYPLEELRSQDNGCEQLVISPDGVVWLGTGIGLFRFDGQQWTHFSKENGLPADHILSMAIAPDESLWVGTWGGQLGVRTLGTGVSHFDGQIWETYTREDGLANDYVCDIEVGPDNHVWVCSLAVDLVGNQSAYDYSNPNLSHFDGKQWTNYPLGDLSIPGLPTGSLLLTGETLWFGTDGSGIVRLDGTEWASYRHDSLPSNKVTALALTDAGGLWVGYLGDGQVSYFENQSWTTYALAPESNYPDDIGVNALLTTPDGYVLAGTSSLTFQQGIARFDGVKWQYIDPDDGLHHRVNDIELINGDLWIATNDNGIYRYDGKVSTHYSTIDGSARDTVLAIAVAMDGSIWFGTWENGVSRFDGNSWTTYTTEDGLADNSVFAIAAAPDGTIWFGSNKGVTQFDGRHWRTFTAEDGLPGDAVRALAISPTGEVWVGTNPPFYDFRPSKIRGGIARFDGEQWTSFTANSGLTGEDVSAIVISTDGVLWIGTLDGGISRYVP